MAKIQEYKASPPVLVDLKIGTFVVGSLAVSIKAVNIPLTQDFLLRINPTDILTRGNYIVPGYSVQHCVIRRWESI